MAYGYFCPHSAIEAPLPEPVEVSVEMADLRDVNLRNVLRQLREFDGEEAQRHQFFTQLKVQIEEIIEAIRATPEYAEYEGMVIKPGDTPTRGYNTPDTYEGYVLGIDLKICNVSEIMLTIPMHATTKHTGVLTIFRGILYLINEILTRFAVPHPIVME